MTVRGIHRAPDGTSCTVCRGPIPDAERPASARGRIEIETGGEGVASFSIWLCRRCATTAASRARGSGLGSLIVSDALENALRTLVRGRDLPALPWAPVAPDAAESRRQEAARRMNEEMRRREHPRDGEVRITTAVRGSLGAGSAEFVPPLACMLCGRSHGAAYPCPTPLSPREIRSIVARSVQAAAIEPRLTGQEFADAANALAAPREGRRQDWSPLRCSCSSSLACCHPWPGSPVPGKIQAGDTVRHLPSGEKLFVLGVESQRERVAFAGWPAGTAAISDCELLFKGSGINLKEREYRNMTFGPVWDDEQRTGRE